jgi:ectoine hydroxylase-related dioxygenase (phytanoyl-CoA dioxygenase family)
LEGPWHQDVTIAVKARVEVDGFGPWSTKQGVQHVQPPDYVLQKMLSVRIHLDDCPSTNGALQVIPRSHRSGKVAEAMIAVSFMEPKLLHVNCAPVERC